MDKSFIDIVNEAGIVGAGGAGFPTHIKLNSTADTVIINGAECEPLIRVDQQLMDLYAKELCEGLSLVIKQTQAKKGVIGLKGKYKAAIASLNGIIKKYENIELFILDNFYPAGDEQILVYEITKKIVPEGGIPLNVGAIVLNVETVLNIHNAYTKQENLTEKYITITGEVRKPITVKVPLGITVKEAIEMAGGVTCTDYAIINGGPMMGKTVSEDSFITKTTKALIILPKSHALIMDMDKDLSKMLNEARTACMHCSMCTEVCPRHLIGHRLETHKLIRMESFAGLSSQLNVKESAHLCCECRLCQYACVMNLMPWRVNMYLKDQMRTQGMGNINYKQTPEKAHPFRDYKKFPLNRLIAKLDLTGYDKEAPMSSLEADYETVQIALRQHIGAPATSIVAVGDTVEKGQVIARMEEGKLGTSLHASITGKIIEINDQIIKIDRRI